MFPRCREGFVVGELKRTVLRLVQVVPYFGADEQVIALHFAVGLLDEVLNRIAYFGLVLVEPRAVEVPFGGLVSFAESSKW
jgi:hypothetical protein